jgi:hypothetical protein
MVSVTDRVKALHYLERICYYLFDAVAMSGSRLSSRRDSTDSISLSETGETPV